MCNWVAMPYSRKLTEHCKPAIVQKNKNHYVIKRKNFQQTEPKPHQWQCQIFNHQTTRELPPCHPWSSMASLPLDFFICCVFFLKCFLLFSNILLWPLYFYLFIQIVHPPEAFPDLLIDNGTPLLPPGSRDSYFLPCFLFIHSALSSSDILYSLVIFFILFLFTLPLQNKLSEGEDCCLFCLW